MCKIAVWARRTSMCGLKVIAFRYPENSDLRFDQPFLIDFNNAKIDFKSGFCFDFHSARCGDKTIWPTRSSLRRDLLIATNLSS